MAAADMPSPPPTSSTDCCLENTDNTDRVKAFMILAVAAMFLLHVVGSLRRQSSHSLVHGIVVGVYTLSYPLVSYTLGWMNSSYWYYDDFAVWAVFLVLLLGSTDGLTALRLDDIDNWKSIYIKHIFQGFMVVYVAVDSAGRDRDTRYVWYPLSAILFVGVLKWYVRIASMRMVSSRSNLCKNARVISEYMQHKENQVDQPFDPFTMQGYRYMIAGERYCISRRPGHTPWYQEESLKVTTVEQIWQCTGNLLASGRGKLLKDLCLSMALSKMLNRRFVGFKLSEAGLQKTHDLVFKGLLVGDKPHQRAFRVIEEELVFVHDMYYTRYAYLHHKGRYLCVCLPVVMIALLSWLTYLLLANKKGDFMVRTIVITVVLALLEAYQLYLYVASGWFKVALIQSYVSTPSLQTSGCCCHEMIIGLLLRLKAFRPWKDRLGQYCILQQLGRRSRVRNCLQYATLGLVDMAKKGRRSSVKLSENVKIAIVDSLLGSNGYLTSGVTSLRNNGVYLPWACHSSDDDICVDGMVTRTILIWHIATTLCQHQLDAQTKEEDAVTTASTLSQYCMYLLAFAPKLLPDHSSVSEMILDQSIMEAGESVKGANTVEERCRKLMEMDQQLGGYGDEATLVAQGVHLARRLNVLEPAKRWKVLSDFWAEMMLYVSPNDDARAHLEALAKGGEFITHLWALLTHAGVLKRGRPKP